MAQLCIALVPVFWIKVLAYMVLGFSQMKSSLCYVYIFEMLHSRDKAFSCSCINFYDALTPAIAGMFFLFIELDVYPLYAITVTTSTLAYLFVMVLNLETPMWLLLNGKTGEAIKVLNFIAWFNGVEHRVPEDTIFIEVEQD